MIGTYVWDADNRTVKPIQDGLIHSGVIKDEERVNFTRKRC